MGSIANTTIRHVLIVRYLAAYAVFLFVMADCSGAAAAGAPTTTLAVTVTVVRSAPVVTFKDTQGNAVTGEGGAEVATASTQGGVVYLVAEY